MLSADDVLPEPKLTWTALDVYRDLGYSLDGFAHQYYGRALEFRSLEMDEQLRVVRAFESATQSMRQILTDSQKAEKRRPAKKAARR